MCKKMPRQVELTNNISINGKLFLFIGDNQCRKQQKI